MPKLPVARVLWRVLPNLRDGVESWILAGGAHHTGFSYHVTAAQMADFAEMAGIESVIIGKETRPDALRRELALADLAWKLRK
jgi:L-arabinose isomerase